MLHKQYYSFISVGLLIALLNFNSGLAQDYVAKTRKCKKFLETMNSDLVTTHKRSSAMAMSANGKRCSVKLMMYKYKGETVATQAINDCLTNDPTNTCKIVACIRCRE